jgi:AbiV family abortive infection protein
MQTFINLPKKDSQELHKALYKNALQLKKDALILSNNNHSFASATSLLILSSEEAIKSILVLLHFNGYHVYDIKDVKKLFRDHKIRHQIAQLIEMGQGLFKSIKKWKEQKQYNKINTNIKWLDSALNGLGNLVNAAEPFLQTKGRIEKLEEFNTIKNKGFYVDFKGELLVPEKEINEQDFYEVKAITERIFRFYKGLSILHHPQMKYHFPEGKIENLKADLKLFINDALKEYKFN